MRLCALADLHYPRYGHDWYQAVVRVVLEADAEVLVVAGDAAAGREGALEDCLRLFEAFHGVKLFVPGNHDLWQDPDRADTRGQYHHVLRDRSEAAGFHYLPSAPLIVDDVGFVGSLGWYDYSFRQVRPPRENLEVMPLRAGVEGPLARAMEAMRKPRVAWKDLTEVDYAGRALMWEDDGQLRSVLWNDAIYTNWGASDAQVAAQMEADLRRDLQRVGPRVRRIVGVCHCVPFERLLGDPWEDVGQAFCRAYMGAARLGQVFREDPRCELVLCGHSHHQALIHEGPITAANCSIGDGRSGPLQLAL